jgi:hypothetical protein
MPRRGAGHGKPHGEMRCKETQTIHFRFLWKADMPGMTRFPVVRIVEFCTRYPWPVLVSAAVIAAAAGFYAVDHFAITTNVSNLLSSRLPSHEGETQYEKVFSDRTIVAVVTAPTPELVEKAADRLTTRLAGQRGPIRDAWQPDGGAFFERNGLFCTCSPISSTPSTNLIWRAREGKKYDKIYYNRIDYHACCAHLA